MLFIYSTVSLNQSITDIKISTINFKDKSLKLFVVYFCDLIERLDLEMVTLDVTYIKHLTKIKCHAVLFTSIMSCFTESFCMTPKLRGLNQSDESFTE